MSAAKQLARRFAAAAASSGALPERKVAILGAAGGIGQPLSMLMKVIATFCRPHRLSVCMMC